MTPGAASLQTQSEAVAAFWLVQWSGRVGLMAGRCTIRNSCKRRTARQGNRSRAAPHFPPRSHRTNNKAHSGDSKAVPEKQTTQEGPSLPRCYNTDGVPLRHRSVVPEGAASTHPWNPEAQKQTVEGNSQQITRLSSDLNPSCVPKMIDKDTLKFNVDKCAMYLRLQLPTLILEGVLDLAWRRLSQEVTLGSREYSVETHQVLEWARHSPALLALIASLSPIKLPLDLSGLDGEALRDVVTYMETYFPVDQFNRLMLPKRKLSSDNMGCLIIESSLRRVLRSSTLVSLTMNLDVVKSSILKEISQLSLQNLELCGGSNSEVQVLQELCGLPFTTADQAMEAISRSHLSALPVVPLRDSLRKFTVSFPNIPSTVYQLFLLAFPRLQHYAPPNGVTTCINAYIRLAEHHDQVKQLGLLSLNLGRASRHEILEVVRVCPALRDVSLCIELDCEDTLTSLQACERLSGVKLAYYPSSVSALPKVEGVVLMPLLNVLGSRLLSLDLTGFNLTGNVVNKLARLPELRHLRLADSWLAHSGAPPSKPFPSLNTLTLNFMPAMDMLQLLAAGSDLHSLDINMLASEGHWNAVTDKSVGQLISTGVVSSITSFSSSSPFLTMATLGHLTRMPQVRNVGHLSRWGLTQDELACVGHSGPTYVLCHL